MNSNKYFTMSEFYEEIMVFTKFTWEKQIGHVKINIKGHAFSSTLAHDIILTNDLNDNISYCMFRLEQVVPGSLRKFWEWSDGIEWQSIEDDSIYEFISHTINVVENNPETIPNFLDL